jgi:type I restriction enzyme S subunit
MSSWEKDMIGSIVNFKKGKIAEQSETQQKEYLPLINADAINGKRITWANSKGAILCSKEEILMLWDGERSGLVAIGFEGVVGSTFSKLSLNKKIDNMYLFYYLNDKFLWIQNQRTGTGIPHVPKDLHKILDIHYPKDIYHQQKIAKILNTVDLVIKKTEKSILKYQAIKKGMMHDLFTRGIELKTGKLRPKYENAPELYKESRLGMIPKDWKTECLGSLIKGKGVYGVNAAAVNYKSNLYTYLRITDISEDGYFKLEGKKSVNHPEAKNFLLEKGDIVFARTGNSTGKTYLYNEDDGILVFAGFLIRFRPNENLLDATFIKFYTETQQYWNWVSIYSMRTGQPGINENEYGKLLLPKPSLEEQKIISEKLMSINNKIQSENKSLKKHLQIKKGLMQDLLTGKVEVTV